MAKMIVVSFEGSESGFVHSKVDRNKLYARRRRMMLDQDDKTCVRAELSGDGTTLILSGMTAQGYFTEDKRWIPSTAMVGLGEDGQPIDKQPCTLDVAQSLEEVTAADILDVAAQSVYALDSDAIAPELQSALEAGKMFRFNFNARADYRMDNAYLIKNDEGCFAIVGPSPAPQWNELDSPAIEGFEDDDEDDLDFEMF